MLVKKIQEEIVYEELSDDEPNPWLRQDKFERWLFILILSKFPRWLLGEIQIEKLTAIQNRYLRILAVLCLILFVLGWIYYPTLKATVIATLKATLFAIERQVQILR